MAVNKRGKKWWVDFMFNRTRYRLPSPDNSVAGAKVYELLIRQKLARGEPIRGNANIEEKRPLTYKQFAKEWYEIYVKNNNKHSEAINKESVMRIHLLPFFGEMELKKIGNLNIEKFKSKKIAENLNAKTINNLLTVFRKSLQCAVEWGSLENLPVIKKLKTLPVKFDFLNPEECRRLIESSGDGTWRNMIEVALDTGLRFGELIALTWDDIDLEKQELTVRHSFARGVLGSPKSNRTRRIPMTASVYETLNGMRSRRGYVFAGSRGYALKYGVCQHRIHRICKKAGLRKIGWHCLRHTFASHLAQRGANLVAIQGLLGHSEIRTTMRYAHIDDEVLRGAIDVLNNDMTPRKLCHNIVTMPSSASSIGNVFSKENNGILSNINKKRAEALF